MSATIAMGPITIQVLRGAIRLVLAGEELDVGPGQMVAAPARERHAVSASEPAAFLLTVVRPGQGG